MQQAAETFEQVELFLSCKSIVDLPHSHGIINSKIRIYTEQAGHLRSIGDTEIINGNPNPDFTKSFVVDYHFEMTQKLKFEVMQVSNAKDQYLLGEVNTTLAMIVGANRKVMSEGLDLLFNGKKAGKLVLKYEKVTNNNNMVFMGFNAQVKQSKKSWMHLCDLCSLFSSDSYVLKLYRITNDFDYALIYESEICKKKGLNPAWNNFNIKVAKLCNSDYFRPIKARVYSRYQYEDTMVGECEFTVDDLLNNKLDKFSLVEPVTKKNTGTLNLSFFKLEERADFLDYIRGGTQLNVMVAVDFTKSNGDPHNYDSLHAIKFDGSLNEYQKAISSVCSILLNYDYDKKVIMNGFGGIPRFNTYQANSVQHCFSMTGDPNNPWVYELSGIMDSYKFALENVELQGPTLFSPILKEAMRNAHLNKNEGSLEYTILLIITDGEIHDMEPTINCLIQSAELPLSVIIVGVGSADFTKMVILDGDDGLCNSEGVQAKRDLVQFVPFRDFQHNAEVLAKNVLEEIPTQLVEYMMSQKIKPRAAMEYFANQAPVQEQSQPAYLEQSFAPVENGKRQGEYVQLMGDSFGGRK